MRVKARKQIFNNVIDFPVKDAAGEIVLTSKEMAPFEGTSPGSLNYHVFAADDSKITDNVTLSFQVSYDGGETWVEAEEVTDLANGSGDPVSVYKADSLVSAPRARVVATFDTTSRLTADAGVGVSVEMEETEELYRAYVVTNAVTLPETLANDSVVGASFSTQGNVVDKLIVSHNADATKMTNITWKLQSSFDGENWWDATDAANISTLNFKETSVEDKLGDYFRVVVIAGATGLEEGHGLTFNAIAFYN